MASALKKLVKEPPTKDDINRAVKELNTDGVRGCAVLAHALLEDMLRQCRHRALVKTRHVSSSVTAQ